MAKEAIFFNAFNLIDQVGPIAFKKLLSYFSSLERAWSADTYQFKKTGLEDRVIGQIKIKRLKIDPEKEFQKLKDCGVELITIKDKNYPRLLKEIYAPPAALYTKGKFDPADQLSLGVVGTRRLSYYGQQVTPLISADLSQAGITIVSGLAKGIDTLAHQTALDSDGRTIAVLGSGLNNIYPATNKRLAEEIGQKGVLISEFPLDTKPLAQHFPQRNRIIAGLSLGILVIEAPEKSGALITARDALEQNREIFAIPGDIFNKNSVGPNSLIKMGAKLVSQANDILEELNLNLLTNSNQTKKIQPNNKEESEILDYLSNTPLHIDKIIKKTKLSTPVVNSTLSLMEIKGKARNLGGNNYVIGR